MKFSVLGSMFRFYLKSWRRRGVLTTWKIIYDELVFDHKYKVDTIEIVPLDALSDIDSPNKDEGTQSQAFYCYCLRRCFETIKQTIDLSSSFFVDMGSGKGRAVMIAAEQGVAKIVGVEFSPTLCNISEENIQNFRKTSHYSGEIEIKCSDVVDYDIPPEMNIVCFYNPFSTEILASVLRNIDHSIEIQPRAITLICYNPSYKEVLGQYGYRLVEAFSYRRGMVFAEVYRKDPVITS